MHSFETASGKQDYKLFLRILSESILDRNGVIIASKCFKAMTTASVFDQIQRNARQVKPVYCKPRNVFKLSMTNFTLNHLQYFYSSSIGRQTITYAPFDGLLRCCQFQKMQIFTALCLYNRCVSLTWQVTAQQFLDIRHVSFPVVYFPFVVTAGFVVFGLSEHILLCR